MKSYDPVKMEALALAAMEESSRLSEAETQQRVDRLAKLWERHRPHIGTMAIMFIMIAGYEKGAEHFRQHIPPEIREKYFNSSNTFTTYENQVLADMFPHDYFQGTLGART